MGRGRMWFDGSSRARAAAAATYSGLTSSWGGLVARAVGWFGAGGSVISFVSRTSLGSCLVVVTIGFVQGGGGDEGGGDIRRRIAAASAWARRWRSWGG